MMTWKEKIKKNQQYLITVQIRIFFEFLEEKISTLQGILKLKKIMINYCKFPVHFNLLLEFLKFLVELLLIFTARF